MLPRHGLLGNGQVVILQPRLGLFLDTGAWPPRQHVERGVIRCLGFEFFLEPLAYPLTPFGLHFLFHPAQRTPTVCFRVHHNSSLQPLPIGLT